MTTERLVSSSEFRARIKAMELLIPGKEAQWSEWKRDLVGKSQHSIVAIDGHLIGYTLYRSDKPQKYYLIEESHSEKIA